MSPVQGTPASRTNAPILTLSLLLLGLNLFFVTAARADTWSAGAVVTYDQSDWGDGSNTALILLEDKYDTVYGSGGDRFVIGIATPGFFVAFTSGCPLGEFLPAKGLRDHWIPTW